MEQIHPFMQTVVYNLKAVINYAEENNLTNDQDFINFLDTINELSVSH